jgi:hypothetical protein
MTTIALLLIGLLFANMAFFLRSLHWWQKMAVFTLGYPLFIAVGILLEWISTRQIYAKHWEFYVVTLCLYALLTIPGIITFVLWPKELAKKSSIHHN